jgi:type IV secretion system protein VirB9
MKHHLAAAAIVVYVFVLGAGTLEAKNTRHKSHRARPESAVSADAEPGAKTVHYGDKDVVKLKTKVRFTTMIILPQSEQILDFACGDKDFWVVQGNQNFAYVKPAKEGATTNLNLITSAGNIYTFVLTEVSGFPTAAPDLKIFVQPKEESMIGAAQRAPRFVPIQELDSYKEQLRLQKEETRRAVDREVAQQMSNLYFAYRFRPDKKPFRVKSIYHDQKFTYIVAKPDETPTLYEIRDGKPNLVNFQYKDGLFVAEKVIDRGYLAIGKNRFSFSMKGE